jgi:alpha-aminoadipic semialdehyde synthase
MKNIIAIRREGSGKRGEKRVAITPSYAKNIIEWGNKLLVQPSVSPETGHIKRAFPDSQYRKTGAEITEDISKADVIIGLKEIGAKKIMPDKAYYCFSHTHKGQLKNRQILKSYVEKNATLIDYELIRDEKDNRLITAFTYNAGYAGMVDTLWAFGEKLKRNGLQNPFEKIPQAVEGDDLNHIIKIIKEAGQVIKKYGTPEEIPPIITVFLGKGKTSYGAQEIYKLLPFETITLSQLPEVFSLGSRKKTYKLVLRKSEIFRLKPGQQMNAEEYSKLHVMEKEHHYMLNPESYESNLDNILPYVSILMNCIIWSPKYPRAISNELMKNIYQYHKTLIAIGDITCDPNGCIEFSKETWIDNPVYIYDPYAETLRDGFDGEGIAVMAVTNLPCEFSADASEQFSKDIFPFLKQITKANYKGNMNDSALPPEIMKGVIMWKGNFTDEFNYMKNFIA